MSLPAHHADCKLVYAHGGGAPPPAELAEFTAVFVCGPHAIPTFAPTHHAVSTAVGVGTMTRMAQMCSFLHRVLHVADDVKVLLVDAQAYAAVHHPVDAPTITNATPDAASPVNAPALVFATAYAMYAFDHSTDTAVSTIRDTSGVNFQLTTAEHAMLDAHSPGQERLTLWTLANGRDLYTGRFVPPSPK
jgi:hypothetical protein